MMLIDDKAVHKTLMKIICLLKTSHNNSNKITVGYFSNINKLNVISTLFKL